MDTPQALGKYELRGTLGRGAMGTVYEGWDPVIARRVAIKTVNLPENPDPDTAEEIARFRREAQAAGRLTHPNIVAVYDYGETKDIAYIVMEYVDGPTLKSVLDKNERFTLPDIRRIMDDLLAGLQFSHDRGVVHRDIKPANVMLNSERRGKIADFGIARIESSNMTQAGTVLGTPAYMSPEQFRGEPVDARTDIYSSGVLLYQLLTGERPFEGSVTSIMHKVLNVDPPAPSQLSVVVPPALDAVVLRAMAKRPEDRFPSASAFAGALGNAIDTPDARVEDAGEATQVTPSRAAAAPARATATTAPASASVAERKRGAPMAAILGGVLVLLLAGGGAAWWLTRPPPKLPPRLVVPAPVHPAVVPVKKPIPPVLPAKPPPPSLAAQLRGAVADTSCILATVQPGTPPALAGYIGTGALADLRGRLAPLHEAALADALHPLRDVFCDVLSVLRPVTPLAGAPNLGLDLRLAGGDDRLHDGARIRPRVTMPRFAGYLRVDYLGHDGSVVHLYPTAADPVQHFKAVPSQRLAAGSVLRLGDGGPGQPLWEVGPPYGTDMIIAIASSQPLQLVHAPANIEASASGYLLGLAAAIRSAEASGAQVTATLLPVDTLPAKH
ncbi:MAG: serine/threonine-protein kinase [Acetobacteraceae bacterium]